MFPNYLQREAVKKILSDIQFWAHMRTQISKPMPLRNWLFTNRDPSKYPLFQHEVRAGFRLSVVWAKRRLVANKTESKLLFSSNLTLLLQLLKVRTAYLLLARICRNYYFYSDDFWRKWYVCETGRQFLIISVADEGLGEMCFLSGLHYPFLLPFGKARIYGDIKISFLGKVRIYGDIKTSFLGFIDFCDILDS